MAYEPGAEEAQPINRYQTDTPEVLYNEFVNVETEVERVGRNIKRLASYAATSNADYEKAKNDEIIAMVLEEASPEFVGKRTDMVRTALYRSKCSDLRLARGLADADLKSEQDLLKALLAKLNGMQSRKGILMSEIDISARRT